MAVLGAYGATMLTVQAFERNLAVLVLALEAKPWKTKPFKNKEQFRAFLQKLISRQIDVFQRASAKALRNRLPQGFDEALLTEIETAIAWRDRLAHRYLVENAQAGNGAHGDAECVGALDDCEQVEATRRRRRPSRIGRGVRRAACRAARRAHRATGSMW